MAWTAVGGKILIIETAKSKGKGRIEVTGHLGDVMKESVRTAIGWIKSNNERLKSV
jgi:ATP-dependent Lon protease